MSEYREYSFCKDCNMPVEFCTCGGEIEVIEVKFESSEENGKGNSEVPPAIDYDFDCVIPF